MARGDISTQPSQTELLLDMVSSKRILNNPLEAIDRKKKAKVEDCNISMEGILSAEAAVQPCQSQ